MNKPSIPGYYYDPEKDRYFKIDKSAPASSAHSTSSVKRRKLSHVQKKKTERYAKSIEKHIHRSILRSDLTSYGLLSREFEPNVAAVSEDGRGRVVDEAELGAVAWAKGVVRKGHVSLAPSFASAEHLKRFWVGSAGGQGLMYTTLNDASVVGCQLPIDKNGDMKFANARRGQSSRSESHSTRHPGFKAETIFCRDISSLTYHKPSNTMLITSGRMGQGLAMCSFNPQLEDPDDADSKWLVGESDFFLRINLGDPETRGPHSMSITSCTPAPASSNLLCLLSTTAGLVQVDTAPDMQWLTAETDRRPISQQYSRLFKGKRKNNNEPSALFSQDFCPTNPNYVFAGGRAEKLWYLDLRTRPREFGNLNTNMSVAYVKSLGGWEVLVAGLKNRMQVFDLRWPRDCAVVKFPQYKNQARFNLGYDVSMDLRVVAATQDDGTVKLWSTRTGRRLKCPAVDSIKQQHPILCAKFGEMPGEGLPSLWVGEGQSVVKYSFGTRDFEDEA